MEFISMRAAAHKAGPRLIACGRFLFSRRSEDLTAPMLRDPLVKDIHPIRVATRMICSIAELHRVICPFGGARQLAGFARPEHGFVNINGISAWFRFIIAAQSCVEPDAIVGRSERFHFRPCRSDRGLKHKPVLRFTASRTLNRLLLKSVHEPGLSR
jgi:hypothetical protein